MKCIGGNIVLQKSKTECKICKTNQSSGHELLGKSFIEKAILDGDQQVE